MLLKGISTSTEFHDATIFFFWQMLTNSGMLCIFTPDFSDLYTSSCFLELTFLSYLKLL